MAVRFLSLVLRMSTILPEAHEGAFQTAVILLDNTKTLQVCNRFPDSNHTFVLPTSGMSHNLALPGPLQNLNFLRYVEAPTLPAK
jgi:hypothetical protein